MEISVKRLEGFSIFYSSAQKDYYICLSRKNANWPYFVFGYWQLFKPEAEDFGWLDLHLEMGQPSMNIKQELEIFIEKQSIFNSADEQRIIYNPGHTNHDLYRICTLEVKPKSEQYENLGEWIAQLVQDKMLPLYEEAERLLQIDAEKATIKG